MRNKRDKLQPRIEAKRINSIYLVLSVRKYPSSSVLVKTTKMRHLIVVLKDKDEGKEAFIGFMLVPCGVSRSRAYEVKEE